MKQSKSSANIFGLIFTLLAFAPTCCVAWSVQMYWHEMPRVVSILIWIILAVLTLMFLKSLFPAGDSIGTSDQDEGW